MGLTVGRVILGRVDIDMMVGTDTVEERSIMVVVSIGVVKARDSIRVSVDKTGRVGVESKERREMDSSGRYSVTVWVTVYQ